MALAIFPSSPLPAGMQRQFMWGADKVNYDSGARQASTPWKRPLYVYNLPYRNMPVAQQSILTSFYNALQGQVQPFFIKDPYDYAVASVLAVASGPTTGSFGLFTVDSWFTYADSTTVATLHSARSGYVSRGTHYWHDQDTGVFSIILKANSDVWGFRSAEYFRKVSFDEDYGDQGVIWGHFNISVRLKEHV